ncbi:type II toxin-antitoxin system VapC family toxin [Mycolicibacterium brumae]|uniref:Twitching motility protein PilT n=1 Tax=Mycolicibacterium brumae TaxID=85968 RepID=A0A2G5P3P5_9MYCO|nr:type II toxin-antitoxin system VapC family toxin [Mycolicibacterium brumae]MCV7191200.1 type II toxin-antitoxin system VapC family toxin [Mycolicibacterium brumae]PIB73068.1 twitching motility protein PilT [Mycolicibacterium brumae]RWA16889.1 twitching motility protein PilT [Mycolicibacterium brumae DSM 44177]UWW09996.1 type II toxin-antitoxin system VapC family toxin [Mycolicibacterium brumae]
MTSILLDTNALLWLVKSPELVAQPALEAIGNPANELYVSAASAWEISIKTRLGRFDGSGILSGWSDTLAAMAAQDLAMDSADATLAGQLNWNHRDPFDRMIVAQATRRGLAIATSDRTIRDGAMTPIIATK